MIRCGVKKEGADNVYTVLFSTSDKKLLEIADYSAETCFEITVEKKWSVENDDS